MIKKIYRDYGQNYYNILQLALLAILNELMIIATFFGIYNEMIDEFNIRKLVWWGLLFSFLIIFFGSILFTCGFIWYKLF
jgi:hypothetical protein